MKTRYSQRYLTEETAWDEGYQKDDNEWMFQRPKLVLNPEVKDFYQMTIDDFELIDYHPIKPQLKLELGI
jgi:thymidylate synthase